MKNPSLIVDLQKLHHNAKTIVKLCGDQGIGVWGVTKVFCGSPEVAGVLVEAGVSALADSRVENLVRLRKHGFSSLVLLRIPMLSEVREVVEVADICLVSERTTLEALNDAAKQRRKRQQVVLMVDLGDLREGIFYQQAFEVFSKLPHYECVEIVGLGTNLTCYGGVIPTTETLAKLGNLAKRLESELGWNLQVVSGGNSSSLDLVHRGLMPSTVNNLRIGEGIALGREAVKRDPIPGAYQDTCVLQAEIVELQYKPSVPEGEIGQDAFGNVPQFEDRGWHYRAIVAVGRQDVDPDGLTPVDERLEVLGASSDHLLLALPDRHGLEVGDVVEFLPTYGALLQATTSPYVKKVYQG